MGGGWFKTQGMKEVTLEVAYTGLVYYILAAVILVKSLLLI